LLHQLQVEQAEAATTLQVVILMEEQVDFKVTELQEAQLLMLQFTAEAELVEDQQQNKIFIINNSHIMQTITIRQALQTVDLVELERQA
jgi:hypothetical protein